MRSEVLPKFRLAAIDLDGTLLGSDHQITAANAHAVGRLQAAGAQIVLASGRHYNSIRKYADALPGVQWIVSCQGGEISDVPRTTVLSRAFLPTGQAEVVLELGRSLGFTPVVYTVEGVFTDARSNGELEFYTELSSHCPVKLSGGELLTAPVFKVIWMGEAAVISGVGMPVTQLPVSVQAVRTQARFLEFMPATVSKGAALAMLAGHLGIAPEEAVVFGDGENDIPMFDWAGVSVAMPHGWPAAIRKATWVAPHGPMETALARSVELVLAKALDSTPVIFEKS